MAVHIFDKPLDNDVNSKPDYATEMPMSDSDSTSVSQAIANKLQSFGYVQSPDMTRQQVMTLNPTDMGNIYGYICNNGYTSIIGFVHKTQEYGGQLRLTYTDGIQYRRYYNGTWAEWQELALKSDIQTYHTTVSVATGYFVLRGIPSGKKLFITNIYVSGASSQNTALIFSVQPDPTNNRYIVYVRKGDGLVPTDTDLTIDILAV